MSIADQTNLAYIIDIVWLHPFSDIVPSCSIPFHVVSFHFDSMFLFPFLSYLHSTCSSSCFCIVVLLFHFESAAALFVFFFRYKISKYIFILSGIYKVDLHIHLVYFFSLLNWTYQNYLTTLPSSTSVSSSFFYSFFRISTLSQQHVWLINSILVRFVIGFLCVWAALCVRVCIFVLLWVIWVLCVFVSEL